MTIESYFVEPATNEYFILRQDTRSDEDKYKSETYVFKNFADALEFMADNPIQ